MKAVHEAMTFGLARVLDLGRIDRVLGEPLRAYLTAPRPCASEWDRLDALADDDLLKHEDLEVRRRYLAGAVWQALGWAWWVLGILTVSVFFLAGNSPIRPGFAASVVYPVVVLVMAMCFGNWAVCLGVGKGRVVFGRPGGGNLGWLLVVVPVWVLFTSFVLFI